MDNNEILLEALPPMQDKNAIVMSGRMNPPTEGHYMIFNKMKQFIREHPDMMLHPIIVIVAGEKSSLDKTKNPLTADERVKFLESSGRCNGFKIYTAKNGSQAMGVVRDKGYEPIVIAAGSDRAGGYLKHLDRDFKTPDGDPIKHHVIPGLDRLEGAVTTKKIDKASALDAAIEKLSKKDELNTDEISGSLARRAAELDYFDEFSKIVGLQKKPELAKMMFNKIKTAMGVS